MASLAIGKNVATAHLPSVLSALVYEYAKGMCSSGGHVCSWGWPLRVSRVAMAEDTFDPSRGNKRLRYRAENREASAPLEESNRGWWHYVVAMGAVKPPFSFTVGARLRLVGHCPTPRTDQFQWQA